MGKDGAHRVVQHRGSIHERVVIGAILSVCGIQLALDDCCGGKRADELAGQIRCACTSKQTCLSAWSRPNNRQRKPL